MNSGEEMVMKVQKDRYDFGLDWDRGAALVRRASTFWQGIRRVFPKVRDFFTAKLGDCSSFRYWHNNWSSCGIFCIKFPRLYALSHTHHSGLLGGHMEPNC